MLVIGSSLSLGGEKKIAASTAAALSHYGTACAQARHSGQLAPIQSEIDRLIAFGIEAGAIEFHELFIAEFVTMSHEIKSVGVDAWCEAYSSVVLVASRNPSAQNIAGSRRNSIPRK